MSRERLERIVAAIDEQIRKLHDLRAMCSEAMVMLPERRIPKRDERQTQSYTTVERVDDSGLQKPAAICHANGCMRASTTTAYCDEHEHKVKG